MREGKPSGTAYRVALRRAAHQVFDQPVIFPDPLALRLLGLDAAGKPLRRDGESRAATDLRAPSRPSSSALRAFLVARSRFAEDTLAAAVASGGATQYVLLGAGLDTFPYRNPHEGLRVFEVDHPDTQAWKLSLLARTRIAVPATVTHVAVDFQCDSLAAKLAGAGFVPAQKTVFAWLGVVPYLTEEGFAATMEFLATCAPGSELIFDYGLPRASLPPLEQLAFDSLASRVTAAGEPFQLFFTPEELHVRLRGMGWQVLDDMGSADLNARYFTGGGLKAIGGGGRMLSARLLPGESSKCIDRMPAVSAAGIERG